MTEGVERSQVDALLGVGTRPRSRVRRWVSISLLLLALAAAGTLLLRFLEGNTTPYYMAPVVRADLHPQLTLAGHARLAGEFTVRAPRDALVLALPLAPGASVAPGQAVAVVDTSGFAQAIAADRLALAAAREQLARARVDQGHATQRMARYDKVWRESNQRVPSLDEMQSARAAVAAAAIELRRRRILVGAARRRLDDDIEQLRAALPRTPSAGVVVQRLVSPGSQVRAGQPLLEVAPLGASVHVVVALPADVGPLPTGMAAQVVVAGSGGAERAATLLRVRSDAAGQREAVFALAPDPSLPPAATATVKMTLPLRRHVLLVPNAALAFAPHCSTRPAGSSICLLDHDGTARSVEIVAGPGDGHRTQILGGQVRPGQLAIIGWREAPASSAPKPSGSKP